VLIARPVFRNMIAMAQSSNQRDPIIFINEWMECSRVLKRVLDIIYTHNVGQTTGEDADTLFFVVDFAKKWEIAMVKDRLLQELRILSHSRACEEFDDFALALKLNDNDLTARIFGYHAPRGTKPPPETAEEIRARLPPEVPGALPLNHWSAEAEKREGLRDHQAWGSDIFELGARSYHRFLQIPPTVVYIILRAQALSGQQSASELFKIFMDRACEYSRMRCNGADIHARSTLFAR